jgi:hypothetical protein
MLLVSLDLAALVDHILKNDWETARWVDTTSSDVEVQLADGDTHSTDSEIAKTENTGPISDYDDSGLVGETGAVSGKESGEVVLVVDGEVETLGTVEDLRVLLASLTDGWGVDDRSARNQKELRATKSNLQSVEVSLESGEEQSGVLLSDTGEVDVLEQIVGEVEQVVLEPQEILVLVNGRVRGWHNVSMVERKVAGKGIVGGSGGMGWYKGHVSHRKLGA